MDKRKLTLAITTFNRLDQTIDSFVDVIEDSRIEKIIISDDASDLDIFKRLELISLCHKCELHRNEVNLGCYLNKRQAVKLSDTDFVILWDSDNKMSKDYLDKIFEQEWDDETILAPDFAMPHFSYEAFGNITISKSNVSWYMELPMFSTALNTCNMFVNRKKYLEVFDDSIDPVTCDSIYFNYCWIKAGYKLKFVKGLQYLHAVHDGSHYKLNVHRTPTELLPTIENNLKQLR